MAEWVLGRILGYYQRETDRARLQAERRWKMVPFRELRGSTWLIVGFGAIGQAVANLAKPFGVRIIGVRRTQESHPMADLIVPPAELNEQLSVADVVVLCLPQETNVHLFDAEMLNSLKQGSVLINVARGSVVDEQALVSALDEGPIEHAILDVFETEPLPETNVLWSHPKVTISAHHAAMSESLVAKGDALFLHNFGCFLRGEPLRWELSGPVPSAATAADSAGNGAKI